MVLSCGVVALVVLMAAQVLSQRPGTPDDDLRLELAQAPVTQPAPVAVRGDDASAAAGVDRAWVDATAGRTGISRVAVAAYGGASLRLSREQPSCRLGWTTLAGIGAVETGHGTFGGATLLDDGRTSRPILGPALDGSEGLAAIRSTAESVAWHGDARWDHAVGPLQFIPSTWERWASDGDGDGVDDPHDILDAAYAAARYLCAAGTDMTTGAGWSRAVHSYNHSDAYVTSVLARANGYAAATR